MASDGKKIVEQYNQGKLLYRVVVPNKHLRSTDGDSSADNNKESSGGSNKSFVEFKDGCREFILHERCSPLPHQWNVQQTVDFLQHIGLGKYVGDFTRNRIDGKRMMNLTEKDMNEIGIAAKGHRMTMRENILKLQKLAHLYQEKMKNNVQTVVPRTPKRSRSLKSRDERVFGYYNRINTILEVEEDGTSMTDRSINNNSCRLSWHTFSRSPIKKKVISTRYFCENGLFMFKDISNTAGRRKGRASSAIETEIIKEYGPVKAYDDSRKIQTHVRSRRFEIEAIDRFQQEQNKEMHEIISHVAQPSKSSEVARADQEEESRHSSSASSSSSMDISLVDPSLFAFYIAPTELEIEESISCRCSLASPDTVFKAKVYNQDVCLKLRKRDGGDFSSARSRKTFKEAVLLSELNHPHVVLFVGLSLDAENFLYVTEYMDQRSLFEAMHSDHIQLTPKCILKMLEEVASALAFLHAKKIYHGNLKSRSILLSSKWVFKVSNFGPARMSHKLRELKKEKNRNKELPYWLPPETLTSGNFDLRGDVYSFGMLIWYPLLTREAILGRTPLVGIPLEDFKDWLAKGHTVFEHFGGGHAAIFNPVAALMRQCLARNGCDRPTSMDLLREIKKIRNDTRKHDKLKEAPPLQFYSKLKHENNKFE